MSSNKAIVWDKKVRGLVVVTVTGQLDGVENGVFRNDTNALRPGPFPHTRPLSRGAATNAPPKSSA